jgi:hypothetical protein
MSRVERMVAAEEAPGTLASAASSPPSASPPVNSTGGAAPGLDWDVAGTLADLDRAVREWGALEVYRRTGRIAP